MAFLTDEIQFNIILTVVVFFFQYRLFIYSFPLSLVSYRPAVDNASAVKRITTKRWNGKSLEFCCELRRRQNKEEEGQYFQFRVYNGDRFSRRGPLTNRMSSLCRYTARVTAIVPRSRKNCMHASNVGFESRQRAVVKRRGV